MFDWGDFWAAAAGALAAFAFEGVRRFRDRNREAQDAANAALLTLAQMYTNLTNLKQQIFDEQTERVRKAANRDPHAYELSPMVGASDFGLRVDMASLAFLMRTHDPDIANRIAVVERAYIGNLAIEQRRAELHTTIQSSLSQAGVTKGTQISDTQMKAIAGEPIVAWLESLTAFQQQALPENISNLIKVQAQLTEIVTLHFPTRRFITFERAKDSSLDRQSGHKAARWRHAMRSLFRKLRKLTYR